MNDKIVLEKDAGNDVICRGSIDLGTACMGCARCENELNEFVERHAAINNQEKTEDTVMFDNAADAGTPPGGRAENGSFDGSLSLDDIYAIRETYGKEKYTHFKYINQQQISGYKVYDVIIYGFCEKPLLVAKNIRI